MSWQGWEKNIYERDILQLRRSFSPSANISPSSTISSAASSSPSKKSSLRRRFSKLIPSKRRSVRKPYSVNKDASPSRETTTPHRPNTPPASGPPEKVLAEVAVFSPITPAHKRVKPDATTAPPPPAPFFSVPATVPILTAAAEPAAAMATPAPTTTPYTADSPGQAQGNRRAGALRSAGDTSPSRSPAPNPHSVLYQPPGALLKGATDENGELKPAALMLGVKLDLEAEVHLTARVRGDITVGLY